MMRKLFVWIWTLTWQVTRYFLGVLVILLLVYLSGCNYVNILVSDVTFSPDTEYFIAKYYRSHSGSIFARQSANLSLFDRNSYPVAIKGAGNIFACDTASPVEIAWQDNHTIVLSFLDDLRPSSSCRYIHDTNDLGIRIVYRKIAMTKEEFNGHRESRPFAVEEWLWLWNSPYDVKQALPKLENYE